MSGQIQLRVGGDWLMVDEHAWGDLTFSTCWPGGSKEASWSMTTTYAARNPRLVRGAFVEVSYGGWPLWTGDLQEPEWDGGEARFTAAGSFRRGERFTAFDASLNTTTRADIAIDQGNLRGTGLGWIRSASIPTAALPVGATTDPLNTVADLLTAHAEELGQRWAVDAHRNVYMAADPTTPTWFAVPGSADLGIADDNYASHVILRHQTTGGGYRSAIYPPMASPPNAYELKYGHAEFIYDVTGYGGMTNSAADALAQKVYLRSKVRPGWTNGLELAADELLTAGGVPADLATVRAGQMLRLHGVPDEVALTPHTDVVVAETQWTVGAPTVALTPLGLVSRTQEDVLTEIMESM